MTPAEELQALRRQKRLAELEAVAARSEPRPVFDRVRDVADQLGQGILAGYGDEAEAWVQDTLGLYPERGSNYQERLDYARKTRADFERNNPVVAPALQVTGAVGSMAALPPLAAASKVPGVVQAGRAMMPAAKGTGMLTQMLRGGGQGLVLGAVHGSGHAEGGPIERLRGAGEGAGFGLTAGLIAPPAIKLTGKALRAAIDRAARLVPEAWKRSTPAQRKVVESLLRDGFTPEQAATRLQQLGDDAALIDVGTNTQGLGRSAATIPGPGKTKLTDFLRGRQEGVRGPSNVLQGGQTNRITEAIDDLVPERFGGAKKAVEEARRGFGKDYSAAHLSDDLVDIAPVLSSIDDEIAKSKGGIKSALQKVKSYLVNEAGKPETTIETLHQAKMAIDDLMSGEARSSMGRVAKARIRAYQDDLIKAIEKAGEGGARYQAGRMGTAGAWRLDEALDNGSEFMLKRAFKGPEDMAEYLARLSPEELHAFRIGAAQALKTKINDVVVRADTTKRIMDIPALEQKIRAAFGDDDLFRRYIDTLQNERTMYDSYAKALMGSRTAELTAEQLDSALDRGRIGQGVANIAKGNYGRGAMDIAMGVKDRATMSPRLSSGLADLLTGRDVAGLAPMAIKAQQNEAARRRLAHMLMTAGASQGGR